MTRKKTSCGYDEKRWQKVGARMEILVQESLKTWEVTRSSESMQEKSLYVGRKPGFGFVSQREESCSNLVVWRMMLEMLEDGFAERSGRRSRYAGLS
jgi:hypothetical protein